MNFELSVIMVPYKCKPVFEKALKALFASKTDFNFEVIIIDNESKDGTVEMVKELMKVADLKDRIQLYENTNEGFPKANNRGLKMKRGEFVLLLNPDTEVSPDTLQVMMDFMKSHPDIGISTCKIIRPDGNLDLACRRSFPKPLTAFFRLSGLSFVFKKNKRISAYNLAYLPIDQETEVDACSGAFMFISPKCLEQIEGFDERFYMYGEDLDLCMKAHLNGFKVWYYPKTQTIHYKGQSSKQSKYALFAFHNAMWLFYDKYYRRKYYYVLDPLVFFGIWSRFGVKLLINQFKGTNLVSR